MDTTPRKRTKILTLHEHTAKNQREIASIVGVNQSTVSRILKQARTIGTLPPKRKEKCGRKRKTSTRDNIRLLQESKKDPRSTSDMLRKDLLSSGVNVSSSTVRRRLIQCGRMARRPVKKQLLTANMKKKRLDWVKKYRNWIATDWRKVLFSDESHFLVLGKRSQHVRRSIEEPIRECHMNQFVKHPPKKMFWGSFSCYGVGSLLPIEGMMNAEKYIKVVKKKWPLILQTLFRMNLGCINRTRHHVIRQKK